MFKKNFKSFLTRIDNSTERDLTNILLESQKSQSIASMVLHRAIEINNCNVFNMCLGILDCKILEDFFNHNFLGKYWMAKRLLKRIKNPNPKIMTSIVLSMFNDFYHSKISLNDILDMQDCCEVINNNNMIFTARHTKFICIMSKLKKVRHNRIKGNLYYLLLQNVFLNPDHPIGYKKIKNIEERFYACSY
jgi:hypothetical protein